jgi:shikimate kinase
MRYIVLIGFMGTGKSVVGKRLASILGYRFLDIDALIEDREKKSIARIFEEKGEVCFREVESRIIGEVSGGQGSVIATGGGAVLDPRNRDALKKEGWLVCLTATPETIRERTSRKSNRPLLQGGDPSEVMRSLMKTRAESYTCADFVVDTSQMKVDAVVETILKRYRAQSSDC